MRETLDNFNIEYQSVDGLTSESGSKEADRSGFHQQSREWGFTSISHISDRDADRAISDLLSEDYRTGQKRLMSARLLLPGWQAGIQDPNEGNFAP